MFFLLFLLDDGRPDPYREAQKLTDSTDPEPEHWLEVIYLKPLVKVDAVLNNFSLMWGPEKSKHAAPIPACPLRHLAWDMNLFFYLLYF